jgi:hypothetical protein
MNKVFLFLNKLLNIIIYLDYHIAQRQIASQRAPQVQQEEERSHPVGIRVCTYLKYRHIFA